MPYYYHGTNARLHEWSSRGTADGTWLLLLGFAEQYGGMVFENDLWNGIDVECAAQGKNAAAFQTLLLDVHAPKENRERISELIEYYRIGSYPLALPCWYKEGHVFAWSEEVEHRGCGALFVYSSHDEWFEVFKTFTGDVDAIIQDVTYASPGLVQEMSYLLANGIDRKTVFVQDRSVASPYLLHVPGTSKTSLVLGYARAFDACVSQLSDRIIKFWPPLAEDHAARRRLLTDVERITTASAEQGLSLVPVWDPPDDRLDVLHRRGAGLAARTRDEIRQIAEFACADDSELLTRVNQEISPGSNFRFAPFPPDAGKQELCEIYRQVFDSDWIDTARFKQIRVSLEAFVNRMWHRAVQVEVFHCIVGMLFYATDKISRWDHDLVTSYKEALKYVASNSEAILTCESESVYRIQWEGDPRCFVFVFLDIAKRQSDTS